MPPLPVAAVEVVVDGTQIDDKYASQLLDVTVRDNLLLPDTAVVRLRDPDGTYIDSHPFKIGSALEVRMGARGDNATTPVFKGEIVALEPEFTEDCVIAARAYDRGYRLNGSRKSRTFQNQTPEDMVKKIAQEAGFSLGTLESTSVVHAFFQQSMETDWQFCWRLAAMHDYEFLVEDRKVHFRRRQTDAPAITLTWGTNLISFRPRVSGVGQPTGVTVANNDPKTAQPVNGQATRANVKPAITATNERATLAAKLGGGSVVVADRVATSRSEADKLAQATLDRIASSFIEADGKTFGTAKLRAGVTIKVDKVGSFSGDYVLSQTTHRIGMGQDYTTSFVISGRTSHGISDLVRHNGGGADWASSLVIGVVTNNNDPDKMGRVRVKFPQLGPEIEGWWARVAVPNAGNERGLYMLPQPGDEVVVAFEHGDARRPFVLGSLYNGKAKPPADLFDAKDRKAKFGVKSDHQVHVEGKQAMTVRSGEKMTIEVQTHGQGGTGDYLLDAKGNIEEKAAKNVKTTAGQSIDVSANQSVTIKGSSSVTVESTGSLKLKGATIDIQASGPVNVKGAVINLG